MTNKRLTLNKILFLLLTLCIAGCSGKFTLIDRSDGSVYNGATDGSTIGGSGNATLIIESESYTGPWIYQTSGGSFGFNNYSSTSSISGAASTVNSYGGSSNTTLSGTGSTFGSSTMTNVSAVGNGMINARAPSGKFVRCIFSFNTIGNTGIGECLRNDGRTYDLSVKR